MSGLDDISNLNESLTQGGKYTSNKSDLLGSFTELQENANEVIHSTIEQFLPGHFDAIDPSGAFPYVSGTDVSFSVVTDASLSILIDNFKYLAGEFNTALSTLKADAGYQATDGSTPTYDLSFGYMTGAAISNSGVGIPPIGLTSNSLYFVSRVDGSGNGTATKEASNFQYSKLIDDTTAGGPTNPSEFDNDNAPDHLRLTCGNLPEVASGDNFFSVDETNTPVWTNKGEVTPNDGIDGDKLAYEDQTTDDAFNITSHLQDAGRRMCNPYNIIEDTGTIYSDSSNTAGQKFATVTYLATQITALVEEMNRRINLGYTITDDDGNEIALTLAQLKEKYDTLLAGNTNVDANLETETLKFDSENLVYIGMLIATITVMAVGFTSLAKKTDMS
jgi:hypothetical protein